jgi:trans-aconitate 2-methyltransferase
VTHLADPADAVAKWATQLNPGGLLMLEEVERIDTVHPVMSTYVGIVKAMLQSQSNTLYAGPLIAELDTLQGLQNLASEVRRVAVINSDAAGLFRLNLRAWKEHAFIRENYSEKMIRDLDSALEAIARERGRESDIEWSMRQVIFQRG